MESIRKQIVWEVQGLDTIEKMSKALLQSEASLTKLSNGAASSARNLSAAQARAERLTIANEKLAQSAEKIAQGNTKLEQSNQRIAQGNARLRLDQEKLAQGNVKLQIAQEKVLQGATRLHIENEKLAQSAEKIAQGNVKLEQSSARLSIEQGKLAQNGQKIDILNSKLSHSEERLLQGRERLRLAQERLNRQDQARQTNVMGQLAAYQTIGYTLNNASRYLIGFGASSVKVAMESEKQFAGVKKTVEGTAQELQALDKELRGMTLKVPLDYKELAAIAETAGQLGVAKTDVRDFTYTVAQLKTVSQDLTSEAAATNMAKINNQLHLQGREYKVMADMIAYLGAKGATTEKTITSMALRISGAMKNAGGGLKDTLALAAGVANIGITPEVGGTAMQRILLGMNNAIAGGKKDLLNVYSAASRKTPEEFTALFKESPAKAIDAFVTGLAAAKKAGENLQPTLDALGIKQQQFIRTITTLVTAQDALTKAIQQADEEYEKGTYLQESFARRTDTAAAKAKILQNHVEAVKNEFGKALIPVLKAALPPLTAILNIFNRLPDPMKSAVAQFVVFGGVIATVAANAINLATNLAQLRLAMLALNTPANGVAAGAAAGGAAGMLRNGLPLLGAAGIGLLVGGSAGLAIDEQEALRITREKTVTAAENNTPAVLQQRIVGVRKALAAHNALMSQRQANPRLDFSNQYGTQMGYKGSTQNVADIDKTNRLQDLLRDLELKATANRVDLPAGVMLPAELQRLENARNSTEKAKREREAKARKAEIAQERLKRESVREAGETAEDLKNQIEESIAKAEKSKSSFAAWRKTNAGLIQQFDDKTIFKAIQEDNSPLRKQFARGVKPSDDMVQDAKKRLGDIAKNLSEQALDALEAQLDYLLRGGFASSGALSLAKRIDASKRLVSPASEGLRMDLGIGGAVKRVLDAQRTTRYFMGMPISKEQNEQLTDQITKWAEKDSRFREQSSQFGRGLGERFREGRMTGFAERLDALRGTQRQNLLGRDADADNLRYLETLKRLTSEEIKHEEAINLLSASLPELRKQLKQTERDITDAKDAIAAKAFQNRITAIDRATEGRMFGIEMSDVPTLPENRNRARMNSLQAEIDAILIEVAAKQREFKAQGEAFGTSPEGNSLAYDIERRKREAQRLEKQKRDIVAEERLQMYSDTRQTVTGAAVGVLRGNQTLWQGLQTIGDTLINRILEKQIESFADPMVQSLTDSRLAIEANTAAIQSMPAEIRAAFTGGIAGGNIAGAAGGGLGGASAGAVVGALGTNSAKTAPSGSNLGNVIGGKNTAAQAFGAYSLIASGASGNGTTLMGMGSNYMAGSALFGAALGGVGGGLVGVGLGLLGSLLRKKPKDPLENAKNMNYGAYNAPSDFVYEAYRYRVTGKLPTAQEMGMTLSQGVAPIVNVYVDGVKSTVENTVSRVASGRVLTSTNYNMAKAPY